MTDGFGGTAIDFDALYRGEPVGGPDVVLDVIPWRLDAPQPLVVELANAGEIVGPVLECGCGLGDNALFLAGQGYQVTAFDLSPTVIEQDRAKAAEAGLSVDFHVADATTLTGIPTGFRTVVDSAMLHCLDDDQRRAYLAGLRRVCAPGARLHVLCFRPEVRAAIPVPASLDEDSLRAAFQDGWTIERMRPAHYATALSPDDWAQRIPGDWNLVPNLDDGVDEQGHILLPIWQITARLA